MRIYKEEIFGPVLSVVRAKDYEEACGCLEHEYGTASRSSRATADAARDFVNRVQVGMVGVNFAIPVPLAYHTFGWLEAVGFGDLNQHGPDSIRFYHQDQDGDRALANGQRRRGFVIPTNEV
jgi:malonate-semialdehyde dehydrogenase (acetylating)/methylmalonate-semialdehyde dehydrogenase